MQKKQKPLWYRLLKDVLIILVVFGVAGVGIDLWRSRSLPADEFPALISTNLSGQSVDLQALSEEQPVLLYFWATWCAVCKLVSPSVDWMSGSHKAVSVAMLSGDARRVQSYMDLSDYDFPVINDPQGLLAKQWGVLATPTVVVLKGGLVKSVTTGITTPVGLWIRMKLAES